MHVLLLRDLRKCISLLMISKLGIDIGHFKPLKWYKSGIYCRPTLCSKPKKEAISHILLDFKGLKTRELVLIKKGDASPFKDFKSCNLKYAKYVKIKGSL